MLRPLRVAIYNTNGDEPTLRAALQSIGGLRIVGQWNTETDLAAMVAQSRPDALSLVLNGPAPERHLEQIAALVRRIPELTVVGIGLPCEPDLLKAAMRARMSELLDLPVQPERLLSALQPAMEKCTLRSAGRLIAIRGTGGGCGATSLAVNLSVELAKLDGAKVAIVDLDLHHGQVATMFDVSPAFTLAELAQHSEEYDARVLEGALARHASGVSILARPRDVDSCAIAPSKTGAILTALLDHYAWVVVDLPVRGDAHSRVVDDLAEYLLLITQLVVTNLRNASQIVAALPPTFDRERLRVIVNRAARRPGAISVEKVAETLRRPVYFEIPTDWQAISHGINLGMPLAQHAPESRARLAIRSLALLLADETCNTAPTPTAKPNVVNWLKGRLLRT